MLVVWPAEIRDGFVTRTGAKYHAEGCRFLTKSSPLSLAEAAKTRTPCSACKPPKAE